MAVYTQISAADLHQAIARFGIALQSHPRGVSDGIENTTYFFTAANFHGLNSEYVLTILENIPTPQMVFSASLCLHLASSGLPVPAPLTDSEGNYSFHIAGKNALVFPRAAGSHPENVTRHHCQTMGKFLARAHRSSKSFQHCHTNSRGMTWMTQGVQALQPFLNAGDQRLLSRQLEGYAQLSKGPLILPTGAIHGDLFRDNALFDGTRLSGVIDFYNACTDWLLLDVAIAVNDWCTPPGQANLDRTLAQAFLQAYHQERPFTPEERDNWQRILCLAATRFWVSRLIGCHVPELLGGEVKTKNPEEYRARLLVRAEGVPELP